MKQKILNNKHLYFFCIFLIIVLLVMGLISIFIKKSTNINNNADLISTYTIDQIGENKNGIWIGSFQLAWNEFRDNVIGRDIEFETKDSLLLKELNRKIFTKDMLNDENYYIKVGKTSPELKEIIFNDINKKFGIIDNNILDKINFELQDNQYTLYAVLNKNFEFLVPFNTLNAESFKNSMERYQYFGITNISDEELNNNVRVLFYNDNNDFAISLKTKEKDEVILYRTNNNSTFKNIYNELEKKSNNYLGNKIFQNDDELKIPVITLDTYIRYDELCNEFIKNTNGMYISNAIQNVKFNLNKFGGNVSSEAYIEKTYFADTNKKRLFYFTDRFFVFLKEEHTDIPYMCLVVNDNKILKKVGD